MHRVRSFIKSQFEHPRSGLGWVAGQIMARRNRERNAWVVTLLEIQRTDHVLEVGFGPGWTIQQIANLAVDGFVGGIDASATMVRMARRRNASAIGASRVELKLGSASALPYGDSLFDKALAVNSMHAWPDPLEGLRELRRVLKLGGRVVITEQPKMVTTEEAAVAAGRDIVARLSQAGFRDVRLETKRLTPVSAVSGIAMKS